MASVTWKYRMPSTCSWVLSRVMYRGALWDVELRPGALDHPGDFRIVEVHGNRLIVADA